MVPDHSENVLQYLKPLLTVSFQNSIISVLDFFQMVSGKAFEMYISKIPCSFNE